MWPPDVHQRPVTDAQPPWQQSQQLLDVQSQQRFDADGLQAEQGQQHGCALGQQYQPGQNYVPGTAQEHLLEQEYVPVPGQEYVPEQQYMPAPAQECSIVQEYPPGQEQYGAAYTPHVAEVSQSQLQQAEQQQLTQEQYLIQLQQNQAMHYQQLQPCQYEAQYNQVQAELCQQPQKAGLAAPSDMWSQQLPSDVARPMHQQQLQVNLTAVQQVMPQQQPVAGGMDRPESSLDEWRRQQHQLNLQSRLLGSAAAVTGSATNSRQRVQEARNNYDEGDLHREWDRDRGKDRKRNRDGGRDKDADDRYSHRSSTARHRTRSHSRSRSRSHSRSRYADRDSDRRSRERSREHSRERSRGRSRGYSQERSRDHSRERSRARHGSEHAEHNSARAHDREDRRVSRHESSGHLSDERRSSPRRSPRRRSRDPEPDRGQGQGRWQHGGYEGEGGAVVDAPPAGTGGGTGRTGLRAEKVSRTLFVKGIPGDKDDMDLQRALAGFLNITCVRLVRERATNASRGIAFIDFATEADAQMLMNSTARFSTCIDGHRLHFEYTPSNCNGAGAAFQAGGPVSGPPADWLCDRCNAVNFARRMECFQCMCARPADPRKVGMDMDGPSLIIKASGLEPHLGEETLRGLVSHLAPLADVRMVHDKFSGAPRGFAYLEFHTLADAGRVMAALQGVVPEGQVRPLRLCYAQGRAAERPLLTSAPTAGSGDNSAAGARVLDALDAGQQYSNWEPKAFDTAAIEVKEAAEGEKQPCATATHGDPGAGNSSFVYDATSGYWYDAASGYYYDANTTLYYHPTANQWFSYNQTTGEYTAVGVGSTSTAVTPAAQASTATVAAGDNVIASAAPFDSAPAISGEPSAGAASTARRVAASATAHVGRAVATSTTSSKATLVTVVASRPTASHSLAAAAAASAVSVPVDKRRNVAVLGSAPKLNSQGLLAAAQAAVEKEQQQKAAALASEREQIRKDVLAKKAAQAASQAAAASKGIGKTSVPMAAAAGTGVQGVVHRGKWSQRNQAAPP